MNIILCDFFDRLLWREYQRRQNDEDAAFDAPDGSEADMDEKMRELKIQTVFSYEVRK